jgi:hypothetical protein
MPVVASVAEEAMANCGNNNAILIDFYSLQGC